MNITIFTYIFYPEPIVMSTITEDLAVCLSKQHNVTVVSSKPCRPFGYQFSTKINKEDWSFKRIILDSFTHSKSNMLCRLYENFSFGLSAKKYIIKNHDKIDVIYMNVFPLFSQQIIIKIANKYGIRTVNHVEDIYPEPFSQRLPLFGSLIYKMLLPIDKWIIRNSTYTVVIGNKIKDFFIRTRNADPDRIYVVYNWQDESRFQINISNNILCSEQLFTFMYVGSISRAADLHNVLSAYVLANIKKSRLVFAGNGAEKDSLIKQANNYPNINIEFIDAPFEKIAIIQAQADVLILPLLRGVSLRAVPSKLSAYLFSGKPILSNVEVESDVAEILVGARCGWISQPENIEALSKKMREVSKISKKYRFLSMTF